MENFKKKLKTRMIIGSVYCCLVPLLAIVLHFSMGETLSSGFTLGMATGIAAVVLFFVIQYAHALRSEEKIRKLCNNVCKKISRYTKIQGF